MLGVVGVVHVLCMCRLCLCGQPLGIFTQNMENNDFAILSYNVKGLRGDKIKRNKIFSYTKEKVKKRYHFTTRNTLRNQ